MTQRHIGTLLDRKAINDINDNFTELYDEYVGAGLDAAEAKEKAIQAVADSLYAKETAETTRDELTRIIREQTAGGDVVPEVVQARGTHNTVGERLNSIDQDLEQTYDFADVATGMLYTRKHERKPIVSFIADDGTITDYTKLKPVVEDKNVPLGIGIVTTWMDTSNYMTTAQIKEMESLGCEIMSHSHTHPNFATLSADEQHYEFAISKQILREKGFNPRCFVYPYNSTNNNSRKALPNYYQAGFAKMGQTSNLSPGSQMAGVNAPNIRNREIGRNALGSYFDNATEGFPSDTTSLEYYKALVDYAAEIGNWLVFVLHSEPMNATQVQHFSDIVDYIRSKNIEIVSPSEGLDTFGNIIEIEGEKNFVIDANGRMTGDDISYMVDPLNARKSTDLISAFPLGKTTITAISTPHAQREGFPESAGGILKTHRISSDYYNSYREYIPITGSKRVYKSYLNSDYSWGEFIPEYRAEDAVIVDALNARKLNDAVTTYPFKKVVYTPISPSHSANEGFPEGVGGILTTYRLSSDPYHAKQTFEASQGSGTTYKRYGASGGAWGSFS